MGRSPFIAHGKRLEGQTLPGPHVNRLQARLEIENRARIWAIQIAAALGNAAAFPKGQSSIREKPQSRETSFVTNRGPGAVREGRPAVHL